MKNLVIRDWGRVRRFAFIVFCVALWMGAFVPLLVDFLIHGRFGWSIIVLGAVAMAWLIIAPWFVFQRSRATISWAAVAVSLPVFLWIVESLGTNKGWLFPLGLPSAAAGLAALGGILWLWNHSRLKFWYAVSLSFILVALLTLVEYTLARPFVIVYPSESLRRAIAFCAAGGSLFLALIATAVHKNKPFKDRPG
jgi:hypothetical protein